MRRLLALKNLTNVYRFLNRISLLMCISLWPLWVTHANSNDSLASSAVNGMSKTLDIQNACLGKLKKVGDNRSACEGIAKGKVPNHTSDSQKYLIYQLEVNSCLVEKDGTDRKDYDNCYSEQFRKTLGQKTDEEEKKLTCKDDAKTFTDSYGKFVEACSAASMGSGGACVKQAIKCGNCDPTLSEQTDEDCDKEDVGIVDTLGALGNSVMFPGMSSPVTNPAIAQNRFSKCPAFASEQIKDINESVDKNRDRVSDLKDSLSELEEDMGDMAKKQQDTEQSVQEAIQKLEEEVQAKILDFKQKELEAKTKLEDLISEMMRQIQEAQEQIRSLELQKQEENINKNVALSKARQDCYLAAREKTSKMLEEKQALIAASQYTAGGFVNLMRGVGLSEKNRLKMQINQYYRECKKDMLFKENSKLLDQKFNLAMTRINQEIRKEKIKIVELRKAIVKAQARLPQILQQLADELASFQQQANRQLMNLQQRLASVREDFARKMSISQTRYNNKKNDLQREELYLNQRISYQSVANQFARGLEGEKGKANEAIGLTSTVLNDATTVLASCICCENGKEPLNKGVCNSAKSFLKSYGSGYTDQCESASEFNSLSKGQKSTD